MTNEEQRIAIAEACGWQCDNCDKPPTVCGGCIWTDEDRMMPRYLNDLNAMHEVEKRLTASSLTEYKFALSRLCGSDFHETMCATATQRAEAFLKVIGKWKD